MIVDTTEFVVAERNKVAVQELLASLRKEADIAISVMTLAELQYGVGYAKSSLQKESRTRFIQDLQSSIVILPISQEIAITAGDLKSFLDQAGQTLPLNDLMIAATALDTDRKVLTRNTAHFERIPGLRVVRPR